MALMCSPRKYQNCGRDVVDSSTNYRAILQNVITSVFQLIKAIKGIGGFLGSLLIGVILETRYGLSSKDSLQVVW